MSWLEMRFGADAPDRPRRRLFLVLLRRLHDGVQCWNIFQIGRRAFKRPDVGVNILGLLVGQGCFAEIRHGRGWNYRRHVCAAAQEGDESLLGSEGGLPDRDTQIRTFSEDRFIPELRMPAG